MKSPEKIFKKDFLDSSVPEFSGEKVYAYEFSNRIRFEALKSKGGEISIFFKKKGKKISDLSEFLPSDWKFAGREYVSDFEKEKGKEVRWFGWLADHDNKIIQIGKFGSPRDILTVLHEIGHAQKNDPRDLKRYNSIFESPFTGKTTSEEYIRLQKEQARILSKIEREAWAYGLALLRKFKDEFGVNAEDLFHDFNQLKDFIDENLGAYRKNFENRIMGELDQEFYEKLKNDEFRKLFDRG